MIGDAKARRRFKAAVRKANEMACVEAVRVWARCQRPEWGDEMVRVMERAAKLIGEDA